MKWAAGVAGAALLLGGCDDGTGPGGTGRATLSFTLAQPQAAATGSFAALRVPIADGSGRVVDVQRVQVVLEEAQLKRLNHDECEDDDDCEYFSVGYQLIDLPLQGGVITPFSMPILPDTYEELEIEIDDPEDDEEAADFRAAHPGWPRDASIRIVGTFDANDGNGPQAFDVFLDIDAEIEKDLVPPLVVDDSTDPASVNVTLSIDLAQWFMSGGAVIDPRALTADDSELDRFEERIEQSIEAFGDDDRDGDHDDDDDDHDDDDDSSDDD